MRRRDGELSKRHLVALKLDVLRRRAGVGLVVLCLCGSERRGGVIDSVLRLRQVALRRPRVELRELRLCDGEPRGGSDDVLLRLLFIALRRPRVEFRELRLRRVERRLWPS